MCTSIFSISCKVSEKNEEWGLVKVKYIEKWEGKGIPTLGVREKREGRCPVTSPLKWFM
jgi:hypothetical protein